MNKKQKELLLEEKEELKKKKIGFILGIVVAIIMIFTGFMGRIFWLIIGIVLLIFGLSQNSKDESRMKEIEYQLLGSRSSIKKS